jgi:hypothetical protein
MGGAVAFLLLLSACDGTGPGTATLVPGQVWLLATIDGAPLPATVPSQGRSRGFRVYFDSLFVEPGQTLRFHRYIQDGVGGAAVTTYHAQFRQRWRTSPDGLRMTTVPGAPYPEEPVDVARLRFETAITLELTRYYFVPSDSTPYLGDMGVVAGDWYVARYRRVR